MNPIAETVNTDSGMILKHEENYYMNSKTLFDVKFDTLKKDFDIYDEERVYELIKTHEEFFIILDEVKPILYKYFRNHPYSLYIRSFPMYYDFKLTIAIGVKYAQEDRKDIFKRLSCTNSEILDCEKKLDLIGKFFIELEGI
jgi:hypothetical protein